MLTIAMKADLTAEHWGRGHEEKVYQITLAMELGEEAVMEQPVPLAYKGKPLTFTNRSGEEAVAHIYPDIVYANRCVIECKAIAGSITLPHIQQCVKYMRALDIPQGIVINFTPANRSRVEKVTIDLVGATYHCIGDIPGGDKVTCIHLSSNGTKVSDALTSKRTWLDEYQEDVCLDDAALRRKYGTYKI